jgi:hypothetical protein
MRSVLVAIVAVLFSCSTEPDGLSTVDQALEATPLTDEEELPQEEAAPECACRCVVDGGDQDGAVIVNEDGLTLKGKPDCLGAQNDANSRGNPPCKGFTEADYKAQNGQPVRDYSCPNGKFCRAGKWQCGTESCACPLEGAGTNFCDIKLDQATCTLDACGKSVNSDADCAPGYTGAYCGCLINNGFKTIFYSSWGITKLGCEACPADSVCTKYFKRADGDAAAAGYKVASCESKFTPAEAQEDAHAE